MLNVTWSIGCLRRRVSNANRNTKLFSCNPIYRPRSTWFYYLNCTVWFIATIFFSNMQSRFIPDFFFFKKTVRNTPGQIDPMCPWNGHTRERQPIVAPAGAVTSFLFLQNFDWFVSVWIWKKWLKIIIFLLDLWSHKKIQSFSMFQSRVIILATSEYSLARLAKKLFWHVSPSCSKCTRYWILWMIQKQWNISSIFLHFCHSVFPFACLSPWFLNPCRSLAHCFVLLSRWYIIISSLRCLSRSVGNFHLARSIFDSPPARGVPHVVLIIPVSTYFWKRAVPRLLTRVSARVCFITYCRAAWKLSGFRGRSVSWTSSVWRGPSNRSRHFTSVKLCASHEATPPNPPFFQTLSSNKMRLRNPYPNEENDLWWKIFFFFGRKSWSFLVEADFRLVNR